MVNIFKRGIFSLKGLLAQLRDEIDEHVTSINENTTEIQSNYAYTQELNQKIDKLTTRLNHMELLLEGQTKRFEVQPLTYPEKQVFLIFYTEEAPLTYADIALKTNYTESLVQHHIASLIEKGIPIIKSYFNSTPFMKLNPDFKELQAKENLLNLSLQSFVEY
jgi:DNA-binding MarR family transcriptional regulator